MKHLTAFWDWVDGRGVVRRIVLAVAIYMTYMTWSISTWAMKYVESCSRPGMDMAAIIAAVTAPIVAFGGYVFKAYTDSRTS